MARKRVIDPEFWLDEDLAKLTPHARLLYIGLWNICDDNYATFPNRPEWIKIQIFPYESANILGLLAELSESGKIKPFTHDEKPYYFIKNFFKWQRIDKPSAPKYPKFVEYSPTTPAKLSKLSEVKEVNTRGRAFLKKAEEEIIKKRTI